MTVYHSDVFTGTAGTALPTYDSAKWVRHAGASILDLVITAAGRARLSADTTAGSAICLATPSSADYEVVADLIPVTVVTGSNAYVIARCNTSGTLTGYRLIASVPAAGWVLTRVVSGTSTQLGSNVAATFTAGQAYRVTLRVQGSAIKCLVDGVEILSVTDSAITAAGNAGLFCNPGTAGNVADNKNWQWDNFTFRDLPAALTGSAAGVAAAAADLATGIALAGAAAGVASTAADLATAITLAGAAAGVASTAADLATGIALAGSAAGVASTTAELTTSIALAGAAVAEVIATGDMSAGEVGAALAADAAATSVATADLSAGIALAASATTATTSAAELTTGIALAGGAAVVAAATGTLAAGAVQYRLRGRVELAARYTGRARRSSTLTGRVAAIG